MKYVKLLSQILACPVCQSDKLFLEGVGNLIVCKNCLAEYNVVNSIPIMIPKNKNTKWVIEANEYANSREEYYRERIEKDNGWWFSPRDPYENLGRQYSFRCGRWKIVDWIGKKHSYSIVLDLGGGEGFALNYLQEKYSQCNFTTISYDLINILQQDGTKRYGENIVFITGDAQNISLRPKSIDIVVSIESIEHIKNISRLCGEIRRILKAKGYLYITTPNKNGLSFWFGNRGIIYFGNAIKRILRRKNLREVSQIYGLREGHGEYERILEFKEIKEELEKNGFEVERVEFAQFLGEIGFIYGKKFKIPILLIKLLVNFSYLLEYIANKIGIAKYLGFTQVIVAQSEK